MELIKSDDFLIQKSDAVVSAGSCFASNIVPYLENAGLTYLRTERVHPAFADLPPESFGYANFSAAYGNVYTARQLLQLLQRCMGLFVPTESRWMDGVEIVDPFRPGLRYRARSDAEFAVLRAQHLQLVRQAFHAANVFVFTLGLTEGWVSREDGAVFPACPGTIAGSFDPHRHEFKNFTVSEVISDLFEFVQLLRSINPGVRFILTVSPVPLVATASYKHVVVASVYSKSVLRVAAEEISREQPGVIYFPAYEIVAGSQAPEGFFENDKRSVSKAGVDEVMKVLLAHCETEHGYEDRKALEHAEAGPPGEGTVTGIASKASRLLSEAECEEVMADRHDVREKIAHDV